jgi:glycosyltransferase involved in cell wall biosynthesis
MNHYSIVIPAYNEEGAIGGVLENLLRLNLLSRAEIIVVDDCSSDSTAQKARSYPVEVLQNVQNFGYGYSIKHGIRKAKHEHIIIMDADGSYPPDALPGLVEQYERGFDMVVGSRQGAHYHGSSTKKVARFFFRLISEFVTGRRIPDINSGLRIFRKDLAMNFFHTLSNGFSLTTTITLAFMLNGRSVAYFPVNYHKRKGTSKVRYVRDTLRAAQIILESIICYNPLKIYLLCSLGIILSGILGLVVGLLSAPWIGLLLFATLSLSLTVFAVGFVVVFLKFAHKDAAV